MPKLKIFTCHSCGKSPLSKNEVGINRKIYGAKPKFYFCIECLAVNLEITPQDIQDTIEEYKSQGCVMFE